MSGHRWSNVSYLDVLRPDPGWRTEYALLGSYSADLVALVAVLLSLAGLDDDRGSGSKVDLANAVDQLADRVRLVIQSGRLVAPRKTPKILTILDRYVREVAFDERLASWHPKVALTKQRFGDNEAAQWRLWVGSRNLTHDLSWDNGLALIGRQDVPGSEIPGVPELGQTLAEHAQLPRISPGRVRSELRHTRWDVPPGSIVHSIRLLGERNRSLPTAPERLQNLVVISPYLDGFVVDALGKWGGIGTKRVLISTRPELGKLASQSGRPLRGFGELLYLDAPPSDLQDADQLSETENAKSQDEEPEPRGLHAKIIYAEHGGRCTIWTGSANATQRGWIGPNSEIIGVMEIDPEIAAGLKSFVSQCAKTVQLEELDKPPEPDETEEQLELARKQVVSAWSVVQTISTDGPVLTAKTDPNPANLNILLSVGLLGSVMVSWPRGALMVQLPQIPSSEITELVCCCLELQDSKMSWLQRAPLDPPPSDERDRQALARYLDPRSFLLWIRSLLNGESIGDGSGDWDSGTEASPNHSAAQNIANWWAPTIEEVLKSWSRDPANLLLVDKRVRHYLQLFQQQQDITQEDRAIMDEFQRTWMILRRQLVVEASS